LSPERRGALCALSPARTFGIAPRNGSSAVGADADAVIVGLERDASVAPERTHCRYISAFEGLSLRGWLGLTLRRGRGEFDDGVRAVYEGIAASERGPGVHVMTGPIAVEGARAVDTLEVRILGMRPRLDYGTNIGAWWGYLYPDMRKERITIYRLDVASGNAH